MQGHTGDGRMGCRVQISCVCNLEPLLLPVGCSLNCGHEVSFSASAYSVPFYSTAIASIITSLSFDRRAVEFGNVTSQENQIAAAQEGYKSCHWRRYFWKCDVESL